MDPNSWNAELTPEVLLRVSSWEIKARHMVEGFLAGQHRGTRRGFSVEFAEHREYSPGDDPRHIDWKIFGKRDRLYVRQYEEEAQLQCLVVLDASRSMQYRSEQAHCSKWDYARLLGAAITWLVLNQGDAVGMAAMGDSHLLGFIPPTSNPGARRTLWEWLDQPFEQSMNAAASSASTAVEGTGLIGLLASRLKRSSVIFLVSDMIADLSTLVLGLKRLAFGRHDVSVVRVLDPAETEFPFTETTLFRGLEGEGSMLVQPASLRDAYLQEFHEHERRLEQVCRETGFDFIPLTTRLTLDAALHRILDGRRVRSGQ